MREVVRPIDRIDVLRMLHDALGHVGVNKLFSVARDYYTWMYLFEDCVAVVNSCAAC